MHLMTAARMMCLCSVLGISMPDTPTAPTVCWPCVFCCPVCRYITTAVEVDPDRPVLVDKYLDRAIEMDVDALCDEEGNIVICGIMEHIEQVQGSKP